jgi:RHS repeat-associated protein
VDAAGAAAWRVRLDAWGQIEDEHVPPAREASERVVRSPFRLLGQIFDEDLQLSWTRFRLFDAETGRWLSPDPTGPRGSRNLFGFDGAPTVDVDPFGLTTGPRHGGDETPGGRVHTDHSAERADERGFSDQAIDAIVDNNRGERVIDEEGRLTREHTDARGNTVVMGENNQIVTVFSPAEGGTFIPRRPRR